MNHMVRWLLFGLVFCSTAVLAKVQVEADTFLWKIEKEGLPESYLLGTIHLGKMDAVLSSGLQMRLSQSHVLILESEMMPDEPSDETMALGQRMMDPDHRLPALLGSAYAKKIQRCSFDPSQKDGLLYLKPWAAAMMCSYALPDGISMEAGIDYLLSVEAKKSNIRILPLESTQEMLTYFENIPEKQALTLLKLSIDHYAEMQKFNKSLVEDYAQNKFKKVIAESFDQQKMLTYFAKEDRTFWSNWFYNELLVQRNKKWLPRLVETLNQEPTLIAVGAAHLVGEDGVIALLRKEGFIVTPVLSH